MPPRKVANVSSLGPDAANPFDGQLRRVANLLALLLVKGESQPEKIRVLSSVGYTNAEIADLLGVTPNAVKVSLYQQRKRR